MFKLRYSDSLLVLITILVSVVVFLVFYFNNQQNLAYYDAVARLNTARKMIDSITPGVGQLGGIWLPFPQVLMVPFIGNDFLWRSGIAGYIVSGVAFIMGAFYMQKLVFFVTKRRAASIFAWLLFVSNLNVLILQTMAMSELFFMCFLIVTLYHLVVWLKTKNLWNFLAMSLGVSILTLTRYEGYMIFGVVLGVVVFESIRVYRLKHRDKIEGLILLFITVAGFGIVLWSIYSMLFYKNPLFWVRAYTPAPAAAISANRILYNQEFGIINPSLYQAGYVIVSVIVLTNGVLTSVMGFLGMVFGIKKNSRALFFGLSGVSLGFLVFYILGYFKGFIPHIEFPVVYLEGNRVREWSVFADNNLRYGIVFLPFMIIFAGFLTARRRFLLIVCYFLVAVQFVAALYNPYSLQYSFYKSWRYPIDADAAWFRSYYDGGMILIAASRHEGFMMQSDLPYKNFIYEGTREYWWGALNNPSKYARWVIYNDLITNDSVAAYMTHEGVAELKKHYKLFYKRKGLHIYKLNEVLSAPVARIAK